MTKTVAVIGDSQAQGLIHEGNLSDQLVAQGFQYVGGYQLPGATTRKLIANLNALLGVVTPDIVIVTAGGNETVGETQQRAWRDLVTQLRESGVGEVYWVSPPASSDPLRDQGRMRVAEAQRSVIEAAGGVWLSGREITQGLQLRDEVHFTRDAYGRFALRLAAIVGRGSRPTYVPVIVGLTGLAAAFAVPRHRGPILLSTLIVTSFLYWRSQQPGKAPQLAASNPR